VVQGSLGARDLEPGRGNAHDRVGSLITFERVLEVAGLFERVPLVHEAARGFAFGGGRLPLGARRLAADRRARQIHETCKTRDEAMQRSHPEPRADLVN
jgi:hypothetical protein